MPLHAIIYNITSQANICNYINKQFDFKCKRYKQYPSTSKQQSTAAMSTILKLSVAASIVYAKQVPLDVDDQNARVSGDEHGAPIDSMLHQLVGSVSDYFNKPVSSTMQVEELVGDTEGELPPAQGTAALPSKSNLEQNEYGSIGQPHLESSFVQMHEDSSTIGSVNSVQQESLQQFEVGASGGASSFLEVGSSSSMGTQQMMVTAQGFATAVRAKIVLNLNTF